MVMIVCRRRIAGGMLALMAAIWLVMPGRASAEVQQVKIGVLAKRGTELAERHWGPTAEYLNQKIDGYVFSIVPLDFDNVRWAVKEEAVDFIVTNTGYYIELEAAYGVSRIATLKNLLAGHAVKLFGGVIITRADRTDINNLKDLKDRTFMAVEQKSLGGWRMAWRELKDRGIVPEQYFSVLSFGGTHDAVVYAVLDGRVDAGTVRSDTLERMASEDKIDLTAVKVLNPQTDDPSFPFLRSTRLYPEWPWAKLRHTPDDLAEKVTIALLRLPQDSSAAKAALIAGWTVPLDYQPVHVLMRELQIGPYKNIGRVTIDAVVREYYAYLATALAILLILALTTGYVTRLNRSLARIRSELDWQLEHRKAAEDALNRAYDELELRVQKRTLELSEANERLLEENVERKRVQEELRRQKEFNENIIRTASAIILTLDENGDITEFNEYAQKMTGYGKAEAAGRNWVRLCVPENERSERLRQIKDLFRGIETESIYESDMVCKDGSRRPVAWQNSLLKDQDGRIFALLAIGVDLTERRRAEKQARLQHEQLIQADKMVALGTLVAGVAHEINNPTTSIMMNAPNIGKMWQGLAPVLEDRYREGGDFPVGNWQYSQIRERLPLLLDGISDGARRVKRIVADLKDYARHEGSPGAVPVDVNRVVNKALSLLSNLIKKSTKRFSVELSPELPEVLARSQRLEQVVINLVMNACQALADDQGGVFISTSHNRPAGTVNIIVRDEGTGIPARHLNRLTDPFFTTKRESGGTGLGLAICSRIVNDCGGTMRFQSEEGRGAAVIVTVPVFKASTESDS